MVVRCFPAPPWQPGVPHLRHARAALQSRNKDRLDRCFLARLLQHARHRSLRLTAPAGAGTHIQGDACILPSIRPFTQGDVLFIRVLISLLSPALRRKHLLLLRQPPGLQHQTTRSGLVCVWWWFSCTLCDTAGREGGSRDAPLSAQASYRGAAPYHPGCTVQMQGVHFTQMQQKPWPWRFRV